MSNRFVCLSLANNPFMIVNTCCITASCRMSSLPFTSWGLQIPSVPLHFIRFGAFMPSSGLYLSENETIPVELVKQIEH